MSNLIEPLLHIFETVIQGALITIVMFYILSTQRRWKALLIDFVRRLVEASNAIFRLNRKTVHAMYGVLGFGTIYFFGILTNMVSFGIMNAAHQCVIADVYANVPQGASSIDTNKPVANHNALHLCQMTLEWLLTGRPNSIGVTGTQFGGRSRYFDYAQDELRWRNANPGVAAATLDPLLKQSRVARGTSVAALLMALWAVIKNVMMLFALAATLIVKGLLPRAHGLISWIDRRFVRTDEVNVIRSGSPLAIRPLDVVEKDIRRMFWTNVPVLLLASGIFVIATGAYKVAEQEYHLMVYTGARTYPMIDTLATQGDTLQEAKPAKGKKNTIHDN